MSLTVSLANPTLTEWQHLCSAQLTQYAFMSHSWYSAWSAHLLGSGSWHGPLSCAVVRNQQQEMLGAFPYAWQKVGPLEFLSLGGPYGPLRSIPMAANNIEEAGAALAQFFSTKRQGVGLRLGPVENTDPAVNALLRELNGRGWRLHQLRESLEFILSVPASLDAYRDLIGNSQHKHAAYEQRRMARHGKVEVRLYSGLDQSEWCRVMGEVETIELGSWVAREGGLLRFSGAPNRGFWADFLADPSASQATKVWLLYFDGEAVSHCVAVDSGPVRYIITNAYVQRVRNFSSGVIVLSSVVTDAICRSLQFINYGEGDAGYKSRLGFLPTRRMQDWLALPPGLVGAAMAAGLGTVKGILGLIGVAASLRAHRGSNGNDDDGKS